MHFNPRTFLSSTIPLTIIVEGIVLWLWTQNRENEREKFITRLAVLTFANIFTQLVLIATLVWPPFPYWPTLLTLEIFIILFEAWVLSQTGLTFKQSLKLSLLLNLVSFGIGLILPV
jgi:hypothetical protein